jgi:large subunit ribosomal protein L3
MTITKAILGEKLGMTQVFTEEGRAVPVTVVRAGPCTVTLVRTIERDGYEAVQLGFGERKESKVTKPMKGHFAKAGVAASRHLREFRIGGLELGSTVTVDTFGVGEIVDVAATSKGHGFSGVMKRHNFHGKPDSHGTDRKHRSSGSIGAGTTPGRVFKGKKGPGRWGHERITIQNLEVVEVDAERNLLLIKGAVPGIEGAILEIRNAVKKGAGA